VSVDLLELRLKRLEENVRLLCAQVGVPYDDGTDGVPDEIVDLIRADERMQAIKRYSELMGCSLAEAMQKIQTIA
jgi:ribosomal protein L7/L12